MKQISFIHAADLHIDSPFVGLKKIPKRIFTDLRESTFVALHNLVETAIQKQVDFVLLVGDIFDENLQSLKAKIRLRQAFERLAEENIEVFMSYGNHDYKARAFDSISYPSNVNIFSSEEVSHFSYVKKGKKLANIYGFSYEHRTVRDRKALEYRVVEESVPFHIATLHGSIKNNREHDVYAPFQIRDLRKEPFDYWALGHIHKRQILSKDPYIVYPGNIQGRHRKELGQKGCYHVILKENKTTINFIPLQAIQFTNLTFDFKPFDDVYDAKVALLETLANQRVNTPLFIDLTVKNNSFLSLTTEEDLDDFLSLIHEETLEESLWKYIFSVKQMEEQKKTSVADEHFIAQILDSYKNLSFAEQIEELYNHRQGKRFLTPLTPEEKEELQVKAKQLVLKELLKGG